MANSSLFRILVALVMCMAFLALPAANVYAGNNKPAGGTSIATDNKTETRALSANAGTGYTTVEDVIVVSNGFLSLSVGGKDIDYTNDWGYPGNYAVGLGPLHPAFSPSDPEQNNVLFGGGDPEYWGALGAFNTIRFHGSAEEYCDSVLWYPEIPDPSPGYDLLPLHEFIISVTPNYTTNVITALWRIPLENAEITTVYAIEGTTLADSRVRVSTTVQNTGGTTINVGVRYLWDTMIGDNDGAYCRTRTPDGAWLIDETSFLLPAFQYYQLTDDMVDPTFSVMGTANGPYAPTPPDKIDYADWDGAAYEAFDYTVDTEYEVNDSSILYYWDANGAGRTVSAGASTTVTQYLFAVPTSPVKQTITAVNPASGLTGETLSVIIDGTNLGATTAVSFGKDITVKGFKVNSNKRVTANIAISGSAATGARDVTATTPFGTASKSDGFTVDSLALLLGQTSHGAGGGSGAGSVGQSNQGMTPVSMPNIVVQSATVSATRVAPGETVTITANLTNNGTVNSTSAVKVYVNGQEEAIQGVTVNSGSNRPVSFTLSRNEPGTYTVYVGGTPAGSFTVEQSVDTNMLLFVSAALVLSGIVLGAIYIRRRQRN